MFQKCCTLRMLYVWTALMAVCFGGSLLLAFWGIPKLIVIKLHHQTELQEGTEQWDRFVELPFPISFKIRFFNVTNPDDVLYNKSKPVLQETEAYSYKQTIKKNHITSDDDSEDSVTYTRSFSFEFDNSGTTKETDIVTIPNAVLLAALQLPNSLEKLALGGCIEKLFTPYGLGGMFVTKTVRELLWDGINFAFANSSTLGYACRRVRDQMDKYIAPIRVIEKINGVGVGNDYYKFSMLNFKTDDYAKSEKPDGIYTVNRGRKNMDQLGNIMRWNGATKTNVWGTKHSTNNETCNTISGTDSTIYRPRVEKGVDLEIFNTDICRTVKMVFKNADESYMGIKGYKYETSPRVFRTSKLNPKQDCFCSQATKDVAGKSSCFLDGLFDYKPCLGAPVLVSQPHFLNAEPHYVSDVEGLNPDVSKHNIYLLLEPNTGTPLKGMKRIQLNSVMRQEKLLHFITPKSMYQAVVPLLWLEEGVRLPQKYVDMVNSQYFNVLKIVEGVKYTLIAVFASLFVVCIFFVWRKKYNK